MSRSLRLSRVVAAVGLGLLLVGCGSGRKPATVNGKLVLPTKVKLAETDSVIVTFIPESDSSAGGATGTVSPKDLTFSAMVPPGKYKVAVTFQPYSGQKDTQARQKEFSQNVGMFDTNATALRHEVTSDATQTITIDLTKSTITSP